MSDFDHAIQEAKNLASTPQGRQLAAALLQLGGPGLQHAIEAAAAGDLTAAKKTLDSLMKDPNARTLLEQLGGKNG